MTELRPFFGFYGGKWRDAVKHFPAPTHDHIVEPFAGSAGFSLRYADRQVTLCERDPVLAGLWRYLIRVRPAEILSIPDLAPGETVDDLPVCEEARWLVGFWVNRAPSRPRKAPSAWMRSGVRPGSFWGERVRTLVAAQVDCIRHWHLVEGSYEQVDVPGPATWFIDPPYQHAGKHYVFGASGIDYDHLAAWCRSREGQVIVCENVGATWLPFVLRANVKTTRPGLRSPEALWVRAADDLPTGLQ